MNKLLILLITVLSISTSLAQSVNGKSISEIDVDFIQIVGQTKPFSKKVVINIDFGQVDKLFKQKIVIGYWGYNN